MSSEMHTINMFEGMGDKTEISPENWNLKINHMDTLKNE